MNKRLLIAGMLTSLLFGCSAGDGDFDFVISPDKAGVIKSKAISCLSVKTTTSGSTPTQDIAESYARFQNVTFAYPHADKTLIIDSLEVRVEGLATGTFKKTIGGDELLALNPVWFDNGEAVVGGPAGRKSYKKPSTTYNPSQLVASDCPLIIGGLPSGTAYQATVTITAYGYSEDAAGNPTQAQSQTFLSISYRGD